MVPPQESVDSVLERLARDVEAAVHALYRGTVRQQTAKARTEVHLRTARAALAPLVNGARAAAAAATPPAEPGAISEEEVAALTRCIMAWLPMGAPSAAALDSRCIAAARELLPTWGEREKARQALRRAWSNS